MNTRVGPPYRMYFEPASDSAGNVCLGSMALCDDTGRVMQRADVRPELFGRPAYTTPNVGIQSAVNDLLLWVESDTPGISEDDFAIMVTWGVELLRDLPEVHHYMACAPCVFDIPMPNPNERHRLPPMLYGIPLVVF